MCRSQWTRALRTVVESGFTAVVTFQGWNAQCTFLVGKAVFGLFINYAPLGNILPTLVVIYPHPMNPLAFGINISFVTAVRMPVAKLLSMINHGSLLVEAEAR